MIKLLGGPTSSIPGQAANLVFGRRRARVETDTSAFSKLTEPPKEPGIVTPGGVGPIRDPSQVAKGLGLGADAERDLATQVSEWMTLPDALTLRKQMIKGLRGLTNTSYPVRREIWNRTAELWRSTMHVRPHRPRPGQTIIQKAEALPGGLATGRTADEFDVAQLAAGIRVEMEHTDDPKVAKEIAMDHLTEDPRYYEKLKRIEKGGGHKYIERYRRPSGKWGYRYAESDKPHKREPGEVSSEADIGHGKSMGQLPGSLHRALSLLSHQQHVVMLPGAKTVEIRVGPAQSFRQHEIPVSDYRKLWRLGLVSAQKAAGDATVLSLTHAGRITLLHQQDEWSWKITNRWQRKEPSTPEIDKSLDHLRRKLRLRPARRPIDLTWGVAEYDGFDHPPERHPPGWPDDRELSKTDDADDGERGRPADLAKARRLVLTGGKWKRKKGAVVQTIQKPSGWGWQPIPGGKRGGFRRKRGNKWEYWYPEKAPKQREVKLEPKPAAKEAPESEPPDPERDAAVTKAMATRKTPGQRKKANDEALKIVETAIKEGRGLSDSEAAKVADFTGDGGISADLNAFYTRIDHAKAMWDVLKAYQGEVGEVLEPSCGSGVFLQTAPKGTKVTGVEYNPGAAAVAEALHGHSHDVEAKSFEEYTIENYGSGKKFDAVIANPPYCPRTGDIPLDKPEYRRAEHYFIDTSLDHMKDGAVGVFLVGSGVMNAGGRNTSYRERLLARAEVLDSFRLPDDTFSHVGCGVSADVVVVRKRDSRVGDALTKMDTKEALTALGAWDQDFIDGKYFDNRKERIIGKALSKDENGGWRPTVVGDANEVPSVMRKLTRQRLEQKDKGPAAKTISFEDISALAEENDNAKKALDAALSGIEELKVKPEVGNVRVFANKNYLFIGDPPKWKSMESVDDVSQIINNSGDEAIRVANGIADDLATLIKARKEGDFYKARTLRRNLADRVKEWVADNGIPRSHKALVELAKSAPKLFDFLACVNSSGELSDILSKDALATLKSKDVDKSDLMSVVNYIARRNRGYVSTEDIQHNWEGWESQTDEEIRMLVLASGQYVISQGQLQHVEDYLTGDLYLKLDILKSHPASMQRDRQIELIEKRLATKRRSIDDIPIQLGVLGWMPLKFFNDYLNSPEGRQTVFRESPRQKGDPLYNLVFEDGVYELQTIAPEEGHSAYGYDSEDKWREITTEPGEIIAPMRPTWRKQKGDWKQTTGKTISDEWFLKYMNRLNMGPNKEERVADIEDHIQKGFSDWVKGSDQHREELEEIYNRTFAGEFRREYSGDELGLEGLTDGITPHDYQNQAVRWAAETGRGILGQDVGLGKTFIAILLARLRKQQGSAEKPMVVVPKSVATNWAEETEALFPGSRVLVIGETKRKTKPQIKKAKAKAKALGLTGKAFDDYVEENSWKIEADKDPERNRKLAMIKQNDYDLIICTKPAFNMIPMRDETEKRYNEDELSFVRADAIARAGDAKKQQTRDKRREKLRADWKAKNVARKFKFKESVVYWEDLGIDTLMADEAHAYKNLYAVQSNRYGGGQPRFLSGSGQSKQAQKMKLMSRFVREAKPTNGVYFLTATPTKNSPVEVFNMLQHISPEAFRKIGVNNVDDFVERFCALGKRHVLTVAGDSGKKTDDDGEPQDREVQAGAGNMIEDTCVVGFQNLKELEQVMDRYMLLQTATDVGLKIPEAKHSTHLVDMTLEQKKVYASLRHEYANIDKDEDPGGKFRVLDLMKKAAQDLELYDPDAYKGWYKKSPKYKACADEAYKGAMERGGQIVFCDHNASHERLKEMLVARGLKPEQIGIINAQVAKDSAVRQAIGNAFNRGEIKVVIGNTGTMGEGVNLQGKKHEHGTTDIHHLDLAWDPGTMHQRNGRGVRQGNRSEQVAVHNYVSKASLDGFRLSTLKGKERWLDKLRSGADKIENDMEGQNLSDLEMMAMASENPEVAMAEIKEKMAAAETEWYVKQSQKAVDDFYAYLTRMERIRGLKGQSKSKESAMATTERLKRALLRNELLPLEIKDALEKGDGPMAAGTAMTGEGEGRRLGAFIVRPGDILQIHVGGQPQKIVIDSIDLEARTVSARYWGNETSRSAPLDELVSAKYKVEYVKDLTPLNELKEVLSKTLERSYTSPLEAVSFLPADLLEQHAALVDEHVKKWYEEHGSYSKTIVVESPEGLVAKDTEGGDIGKDKVIYPWGKDRARLVEAIAQGNTSTHWETRAIGQNKIMSAVKNMLGWRESASILSDAEKVWEKQQQAAA